MHSDRRSFLKTTAAGVASATAASFASTGALDAQATGPAAFEMPRNMTLLNLRTPAGPRLGVKLPKGILDVAAAAAMYKLPAPVDTDDLLQRGLGGWPQWWLRRPMARPVSTCRRAPCGTRRSSRAPRRSS
jgi:hypothetical protein